MSMDARLHYYCFVHRLLPQAAWSNPAAFCGAMASPDHEKILRAWWDSIGDDLPSAERFPWPSISVIPSRVGSHFVILFTFPPPAAATEAFFSAFVLGPIKSANVDELKATPQKYYILEQSFCEGGPATVFAEWTSDGTHRNYGDGPLPSAEAFLNHIKKVGGLENG